MIGKIKHDKHMAENPMANIMAAILEFFIQYSPDVFNRT
jgi:hypothetical protein